MKIRIDKTKNIYIIRLKSEKGAKKMKNLAGSEQPGEEKPPPQRKQKVRTYIPLYITNIQIKTFIIGGNLQ